ncbi:response regulator receiver protein [Melioribacter roseus P3M-2]|uniref:Response regulator receiver protein n=1 Tax=Melioribacter roseus (strain DSM 23840 / JCM 17771 / VKM B-2668 / P3M-2) TaxID=1191523 RepID=I6Z5P1_MELRP|nr:response regulator transcription factor [Melioribacter roseus]AFN74480.1 response regulator receiver protein [Melioribacter roseus P3M-2]
MKKVLIVDDSHIVRHNLKKIIDSIEGIELYDEAEDYQSAIEKIVDETPDILILDINLGEQSGIDILYKIKSGLNSKPIVIMFTNYTDPIFRKAAKEAEYFFDKSADIEKLISTLKKLGGNGTVE